MATRALKRRVMVALAIPAAVFLTGAVYQTLSVRRESIRFPPPGRAHSGSCEAQAQLRLSWIRRGYRFPLNRAGGTTQITYDRSTGKTHLRASDTGFWGVLNRLHHFHGLHNQTGVRNLWGWTVLFASLGLFALGGTGIFMWFKLYKERTIGLVLLGANLVVSVGLLIALRM